MGCASNCGCSSLRGLGAASAAPTESVTVTATAIPCPELFRAYLNSGSTWDRIKYNLCLAWHHMEDLALAPAHWARGVWDSLVSEYHSLWASVQNGTSSAWSAVKQGAGAVRDSIANGASALLTKTENLLTYLRRQLGRVADNLYQEFGQLGTWLLIAGGILLAVELAPAINDVASRARRK